MKQNTNMDFKDLCIFFEEIKRANGPSDKQKLVKTNLVKIREQLNDLSKFFQVFRLIVPNLDRERDSYNMKEAKVARILIKMLDLPNGNDKNVLSKSYLMAAQANDFGDVVYSVIRKYLSNHKTTLSIKELNEGLDNLTNRKNELEAESILTNLFKKASPDAIRWIIRIILKDLKLGLGSNTILNCYHKDGAAFYDSNSNLRKVCEILKNENVRLHELEIEIFEAFRPMLSKKIEVANFTKSFPENKLFYVENKFDGERFQIHLKGEEFRYFSRNGFDYTDNLGKSYDCGVLTPRLEGLFQNHVKTVILDGELMLYNKYSKQFGSKGMNLDVKKLNLNGPYQPCFCVYDIILLNDKVLTNVPLKERLKILQTVFTNVKKGTIEISEVEEVSSRQEIVDALNRSVEKGEEGIIIKNPDSIYKYSDRNSGWFKMKLEFFQDVMNDLDLILMGADHTMSTSDKLNSFYVGIRCGNAPNGKPLYLSFGKVSSGLNYEEQSMLNNKFKSVGKHFDNFDCENLLFGKDKPRYYLEPENAVIFQIRASELTRDSSKSFKTHYTFRFPRILKIRDDKPVDECLSINELLELTENNKAVIKLNKRNIELDEIIRSKPKRVKRKEIIMPKFYDTTKVSDMLEGYTIFVLDGRENFEKENAESLVKKAGGTVKYRVNDKVDIILTPRRNAFVQNLIKNKPKYDIINLTWLERIIKDGNLLGYSQDEVFYIGWNYKNCLADELDKYGDNFTKETTVEKLKETFRVINDMNDNFSSNSAFLMEGRKYFGQYTAYFDKYLTPSNKDSDIIYNCFLDELQFKYHNGNTCETITDYVNIIIFNGDNERKEFLINFLSSINRCDIKICNQQFIYD
ncbi:DNA ligase 4 isoform X1 [Diorhabda carinulata]|uniref:DNA ligase 4 isoform X1 n=2 Tax=Diorhabda carinulata TaxID=1163345 RepID=UPI0025A20879|nr:DNA ligase 4 isoform X1 [Diorhabda carinulata]